MIKEKLDFKEPVYFFDIEQNSEEWDDIRSGMVTASQANSLFVKGRQEYGLGVGGVEMLDKIIEERLNQFPRGGGWKGNKDTEYGHYMEPLARERYTLETFQIVKQVGFVAKNEWLGSSPDGVVGKEGLVQIKCFPVKHLGCVRAMKNGKTVYDVLSKDLRIQVQYELWITDRQWSDIVFFKEDVPESLQFYKYRIYPDKDLFIEFEQKTQSFIKAVKTEAKKLGFKL